MKIIWSKKAKYSFYTIRNYLELYWSPLIAKKFINDVLHINKLLEKNPQLGKYRADLECREIVISKHVTLYYETNENSIWLIAFWNNCQEPVNAIQL
jgi:plasmid stabilization system protein ParE